MKVKILCDTEADILNTVHNIHEDMQFNTHMDTPKEFEFQISSAGGIQCNWGLTDTKMRKIFKRLFKRNRPKESLKKALKRLYKYIPF